MGIRNRFRDIKPCLGKLTETILLISFTSVLVFYFVEAIYFQSFSTALRYILLEWGSEIKLLNLGIVILLEVAMYVFWHNVGTCFAVTSVFCCVLAIVNELKMNARGEAFTFSDIAVAKEALLVAGNYDLKLSSIDWQVILLILVMTVILILFKKSDVRSGIHGKKIFIRIAAGFLCIGILIGVCRNMGDIMAAVKNGGEHVYVVSQYYNQNGFLVGFARTTFNQVQAPENYSRQTVDAIYDSVNMKTDIAETPNIIFVMNESLYDVSVLDGVKLNRDPLAELRKLQEKYTYGTFVSPSYGGGTCNVEFEVLTGCPMDEVGLSTLPYSEMLHHEIDSLACLMNENGYYSVAVHPNTGTYFNRRNVYRYMGFQEVFFTEEMGELPTEGQYAGDQELYERVIDLYEEKGDKPFFAYVITMQNHGGYEYQYDESGIEVSEGGSCGNERALQTYCNLVDSSVEAFQYLIRYFETVDRPTVIVMFGDHSPNVMGSFEYSAELLLGASSIPLYRTTPLVVYYNYDLPYEDWGYINGYNLASKVMDYCGISMDSFWAYGLDTANVPKLGNYYYVDDEWVSEGNIDSGYIEYKRNMWIMAYDRIFGRNYYGDRQDKGIVE